MQINRILSASIFILVFVWGSSAFASDGFNGIRCGTDIPKALIGKAMTNERAEATESRHKDLGLKDLGATEITDQLLLISWNICGDEYALLEKKDVVHDAMKFPPHSKDSPQFVGSCQNSKGPVPGTIIAVLKNEHGDLLPVTIGWSIDEKQAKFVPLKTEGLRCPRSDISTVDQEH